MHSGFMATALPAALISGLVALAPLDVGAAEGQSVAPAADAGGLGLPAEARARALQGASGVIEGLRPRRTAIKRATNSTTRPSSPPRRSKPSSRRPIRRDRPPRPRAPRPGARRRPPPRRSKPLPRRSRRLRTPPRSQARPPPI